MTDIIIIGAGAAGLTASIYALRSGLSVTVFEKNIYGGQIAITNEIENYPAIEVISGADFANAIYNQAVKLGADVKFEEIQSVSLSGKIKSVTTSGGSYEAKSIIIANGVSRRKLGCKGEDELVGRGVSYCATCDGAFFRNQEVAIVGGGNTALTDALYLANLCSRVLLIHRRDTFRADKVLVDAILSKQNIDILYDSTVTQIKGENRVSSIETQNKKTGESKEHPVSAVFIAIGLEPHNELFQNILSLDKGGYIISDENCLTGIDGIYVAGDCRTKELRQIITAAADGAVAAHQATTYITSHQ